MAGLLATSFLLNAMDWKEKKNLKLAKAQDCCAGLGMLPLEMHGGQISKEWPS